MTHQLTLAQLLKTHAAAGVFSLSDDMAQNAFDAATEARFNAWHIDLSPVRSSKDLLSLLGQALQFPEWYGQNWDALADCLADMSWCEAEGHVLLIHGLATLQKNDAPSCHKFVELLQETSLLWREEGVPFWGLLEENSGDPIGGVNALPFKS